MITFERFSKNINLAHLAYVNGADEMYLRIIRGILVFFPNGKEQLEHFCIVCNFGLLEGHEMEIEELYTKLLENETLPNKSR